MREEASMIRVLEFGDDSLTLLSLHDTCVIGMMTAISKARAQRRWKQAKSAITESEPEEILGTRCLNLYKYTIHHPPPSVENPILNICPSCSLEIKYLY